MRVESIDSFCFYNKQQYNTNRGKTMAYTKSVTATITNSTSTAGVSNLTNSIFISAHAFFKERVKGYSTMAEVNSDSAIPTDSNLYLAMQQAFSNDTFAVPVYAGRREVDTVTLTPTVASSTAYTVTLQAYNTLDGTSTEEYVISFTSDSDATAVEIVAGLDAAITTAGVPTTEITTDITTSDILVLAPAANRQIIVTGVSGCVQTFTSTEDAATCFSETTDENNEDYYFVTSESRDDTFVLELAQAVEATTGSYPKQFRVSCSSADSIVTKPNSAVTGDLLQLIQDPELSRSSGEWHDQSDTIFPELSACVKVGSYDAGTVNWKFIQGTAPEAQHPIKDRSLTTTEQGYILDRNASVVSKELGLTFMHGGKNADGAYTDLLQITDWTRLEMEARSLTAVINANNGGLPITMTSSDLEIIKDACQSVLTEGVDLKLFSGFDEIVMPTSISFADQAARILDNVSFTAYFAAKVNFVIIDGNLTYNEEIS